MNCFGQKLLLYLNPELSVSESDTTSCRTLEKFVRTFILSAMKIYAGLKQ